MTDGKRKLARTIKKFEFGGRCSRGDRRRGGSCNGLANQGRRAVSKDCLYQKSGHGLGRVVSAGIEC
jgi:hypothetical protein